MSPDPVTIAIIGFSGLIGARHTTHVLANPSTKLVALVDPSPTAAPIAASHKVPYYPTVAAMLAETTPDAAMICTPNSTHVPVAMELASAGIHLFVEKPLCTSVAEGLELVKFAKEKGMKLLVGHHRRFNPYVIATKKAISEKKLGEVTAVSGLWTNYKPAEYFDGNERLRWRSRKSEGGGVVLINFVHEIDAMQYFFGRCVRVHAEKTISRRGDGEDKAEEGVVLTLRFESGVVGVFVISDCVVSPHSFEAGTDENPMIAPATRADGEKVDCYRILGTEGTLSVPDMTFWSYGAGKKSWENELQREKVDIDTDQRVPFERQLDHFVRVVRGTEEPRCSGVEGLRAMMVCDAVRRAIDSESGTVVVEGIEGDA
jgi:predicted dehydrogenase